jgi:ribonuclease T2
MLKIAALLAALLLVAQSASAEYCSRSQACWPTTAEIMELYTAMDPHADRKVVYANTTYPSAVPIYSPNNQPLYGFTGGASLQPLYYASSQISSSSSGLCFTPSAEKRPECLSATRNNPRNNTSPALTAFPLTTEHVVLCVQFARKHNLCLTTTGKGTSWGCNDGFFLRTTLIKGFELSSDQSTAVVGAGMTFSELHSAASKYNRFLSSGWSITVGIAGWSFGGCHGPFAPSRGLGVDNLVGATLVTVDGDVLELHSDDTDKTKKEMLWAVRGGDGATFGIVTSLTVTTHEVPKSGFLIIHYLSDIPNLCADDGLKRVEIFMDTHSSFAPSLSKDFSGLTYLTPAKSKTLPKSLEKKNSVP